MRCLLLVVVVLLAAARPAAAQDPIERAADALRDERIYVAPTAELGEQVDVAALRARIDSSGAGPMYVAVLPQSATAGSAGRTLLALRDAVGETGTYALAIGDQFRTLSSYYSAATAGDAARAAHPDDLQATLIAFIDRTAAERENAPAGGSAGSIVAVAVLVAVALGGGA